MKGITALALFLFGSLLFVNSCSSDDEPKPDRALSDTTGRQCSWCEDGSCNFTCDPPGSACSNHEQEWRLKGQDVLHLCQLCPTSGPEEVVGTDCHPVVCSATVDCFMIDYECVDARCIFPCTIDADCVVDGISCTEGRCIFPE